MKVLPGVHRIITKSPAQLRWGSTNRRRHAIKHATCLMLVLYTLFFTWVPAVRAEGSQNLYPDAPNSYRGNLEWRTSAYGAGLLRRGTLLKVFAKAGEVILTGSTAVGVDEGDILIFNPNMVTGPIGAETIPATASFSCAEQRANLGNANQGRITSRAQEQAGPDTISNALNATPGNQVANGYVPCFYLAPETGIYDVIFHGPAGGNSNLQGYVTGEVGLTGAKNFNQDQVTSVAAWDVTVRAGLTSTTNLTGRLFSYALALFTNGNARPVYSTIYVVTTDGYLYQVDLRGLDFNGFLIYSNRVGFLDSDGKTPLYHDVLGSDAQLNQIEGGVSLARPEHPLFFSRPDPETLTALGLPLEPIRPEIAELSFSGTVAGNTSYVGTGGTFHYTANVEGVHELIISRDGVNFDPTNPSNRVLRGLQGSGSQTVSWNGLDNSGVPFPASSSPYKVRASIHGAEMHFPLLDPENSINGGPSYTLLNPPDGICPPLNGGCRAAFYDDRGYRTANGATVGTEGQVLCGTNPPDPPFSDPIKGFDSGSNQRAFGTPSGGNANQACAGSFGDTKGLDLWTYYPGNTLEAPLNIVAEASDLSLTKTADPVSLDVGQNTTFTIVVSNAGPNTATNVQVTDQLPSELAFVAATPSQGSYDQTSGIWSVGTLPAGANATLTLEATVTAAGQYTNVAQVSAADQFDPDSTPNNNNPAEDDQAAASVSAKVPTAIDLASFTATSQADGILVHWVTNVERDTWGFYLYRSDDRNRANAVRITPQLILGRGRGQTGATYTWHDSTGQPGKTYTYWLQEVELNGNVNEYGPATAARPAAAGSYALFLPIFIQ